MKATLRQCANSALIGAPSGASSHSGRRTFVTRCAKGIAAAGGSLKDMLELAGHASLATTQRYIRATATPSAR